MSIKTKTSYTCDLCHDIWHTSSNAKKYLFAYTLEEPGVLSRSEDIESCIHICIACSDYLQQDHAKPPVANRKAKKKKGKTLT